MRPSENLPAAAERMGGIEFVDTGIVAPASDLMDPG
jgi:hypothetical protein